jgi:hypothetical protein
MTSKKEKIRKYLIHVRDRSLMYVTDRSYLTLSTFIDGVLSGMAIGYGKDYFEGINPWMSERFGQKSSSVWTFYIWQLLAKEDEERAKQLLFEVLFEYLEVAFKDD